ncbi:MAG TPA: hypothetical protein VNJ29_02850 [Candidatus Nitrosotenuis sp.]|nr:hypothetical protein [Candidatus Nitrosotenuis sp.]
MEMEWNLYQTLVYHENAGVLSNIETAAAQGKISKSLLSLAYAVFGKIEQSEHILNSLEESAENLFELETKMLLLLHRRKRIEAMVLAMDILNKYPMAAFARYFLGTDAIRKKRPEESANHCKIFLEYYPKHDNVTLQLAEALAYMRRYQQSLEYVKQCKPSLKHKLYLLLIPSVLPKYRFILVLAGIPAAALGLPMLVLVSILLILFLGILISVLKYKGTLIPTRLFYLAIMIIISWWFGHWVWSLM